jgi:hypothetical protein
MIWLHATEPTKVPSKSSKLSSWRPSNANVPTSSSSLYVLLHLFTRKHPTHHHLGPQPQVPSPSSLHPPCSQNQRQDLHLQEDPVRSLVSVLGLGYKVKGKNKLFIIYESDRFVSFQTMHFCRLVGFLFKSYLKFN